jgi:hypothetical protein
VHFGNYTPHTFGWSLPVARDVVPLRVDNASFPGGVHHAVAPIFREALRRVLTHLPGGLHPGACWGYEHRNTTGGTGLSFHAYGLAIDVNAPDNPYVASGQTFRHTMPESTDELIRPLGLEWGGDWTKPKDYMHLEFHGTPAEADHIVNGLHAAPAPAPVPAPAHAVYAAGQLGKRVLRLGMAGDDVRFVQRFIGSKWCGPADGAYGAGTAAGVARYQRMRGLAADGIVGPATWHQLGLR